MPCPTGLMLRHRMILSFQSNILELDLLAVDHYGLIRLWRRIHIHLWIQIGLLTRLLNTICRITPRLIVWLDRNYFHDYTLLLAATPVQKQGLQLVRRLLTTRHRLETRARRFGTTTGTNHLITRTPQKQDRCRKDAHQTGEWDRCKYQQTHNDMQLKEDINPLKVCGWIRPKIDNPLGPFHQLDHFNTVQVLC